MLKRPRGPVMDDILFTWAHVLHLGRLQGTVWKGTGLSSILEELGSEDFTMPFPIDVKHAAPVLGTASHLQTGHAES